MARVAGGCRCKESDHPHAGGGPEGLSSSQGLSSPQRPRCKRCLAETSAELHIHLHTGVRSGPFFVQRGSKQGDQLGTLLFNAPLQYIMSPQATPTTAPAWITQTHALSQTFVLLATCYSSNTPTHHGKCSKTSSRRPEPMDSNCT